ncbi:MAG: putative N-acetylmannosamine-6-phosphate 2-epimerase [Rhizobiaceae bacterium]|nr:putative N-acetylmannosamine-6-phosphate 2-epimerase [Rhizobiaceae bacterium]
MNALEKLDGKLVVSCQPVDDGPMDRPEITAAMALAAAAGGAAGLRLEGLDNLAATRSLTELPIIGIVKRDLADSEVRISPFRQDIVDLAELGADIIAYDATQRPRPEPTAQLVEQIKQSGKIAMADCATLADAKQALSEGADIIGTTLSGYAYHIAPDGTAPDTALVGEFAKLTGFVMAEGRYNSPALAARAMAAGANCVTVGSAVTRVEHITDWFVQAVAR